MYVSAFWRRLVLTTGFCIAFAAGGFCNALAVAEVRNPQGVAVIVGNKDYRHRDIPSVSFAHRDADAFRRYVVEVLGFKSENIIDLRDATRAQFLHTFGRKNDDVSDLWAKLLPNRRWDVVVFYSGHGVPGLTNGKGYLLPVDVPPRAAQEEGYPLELLYEKLGVLPNARSVHVYLDACFSGASDGGPLVRSASPVVVRPALPKGLAGRVTAVSASRADQIASWDEKVRHGLFTHHLLDALYGKGDADGDGKVTAKEVEAYLDGFMTRAAWLQHRRKQNANVTGAPEMVLASSPPGGFPERPSIGAGVKAVKKKEKAVEVVKPPVLEKEPILDREKKVLVQRGLISLRLYKGFVDGAFGPKTHEAIRAWQKAKGYGGTGYLTKAQADVLAVLGEEAQRKKADNERKVREARQRAEAERKTREKVERERVIREAKAQREADRRAREEAERARKARETKEREKAEREKREKAKREKVERKRELLKNAKRRWKPAHACPPHCRGDFGWTTLHYAVSSLRVKQVEKLLNAGANPNLGTSAFSYWGKDYPASSTTSFHVLFSMGSEYDTQVGRFRNDESSRAAIAELLLRAGADPNVKDGDGDKVIDLLNKAENSGDERVRIHKYSVKRIKEMIDNYNLYDSR